MEGSKGNYQMGTWIPEYLPAAGSQAVDCHIGNCTEHLWPKQPHQAGPQKLESLACQQFPPVYKIRVTCISARFKQNKSGVLVLTIPLWDIATLWVLLVRNKKLKEEDKIP